MEVAETSRRSLGELFVERGLISEADLERALAEQSATNRRLADILVRRGLVSGHDITAALMEQMQRFGRATGAPAPLRPVPSDDLVDESPAPESEPFLLPVADPHDSDDLDEPPAAETKTDDGMETENDFGLAPAAEPAAPSALFDLAGSVDAVAPASHETVIREAEARQRTSESRLESLDEIWDGLERIQAELEAQKLATPPLVRELGATQERVQARRQELADEIATLKHVRDEVARKSGQLDELRADLTAKIRELSELQATAASWNARVTDLESEVASLSGRANDVARELAALAEGSVTAPALETVTEVHESSGPHPVDAPSLSPSHLLFVPTDDGYDLVERDGPPPSVGEGVQFGDGGTWVVTKVGPSPLPFDARSCVFFSVG
jgi:DNA repair exonuclease SbcCD ATPase subunit